MILVELALAYHAQKISEKEMEADQDNNVNSV